MQRQNFGLEIVTAPTTLPIPVSGTGSAKSHSRILGRDALDADITEYIKVAADYIEGETNLTLCPTQYRMTLDRFPTYYGTQLYPYDFVNSMFRLPRFPVISVDSIVYMDVQGNTQTLNNSVYQLANSKSPARISPVQGQLWPFTNPFELQAVAVTFTAGYASQSLIPPIARQAVRFLFAHFYENREALVATVGEPASLPYGLKAIIRKLKTFGFTQWN